MDVTSEQTGDQAGAALDAALARGWDLVRVIIDEAANVQRRRLRRRPRFVRVTAKVWHDIEVFADQAIFGNPADLEFTAVWEAVVPEDVGTSNEEL